MVDATPSSDSCHHFKFPSFDFAPLFTVLSSRLHNKYFKTFLIMKGISMHYVPGVCPYNPYLYCIAPFTGYPRIFWLFPENSKLKKVKWGIE
ncbi:hypothetical protein GCM10008915_26350 [Bifidobacterium pullorum subsp. gallinarum]